MNFVDKAKRSPRALDNVVVCVAEHDAISKYSAAKHGLHESTAQ